MNRVSQEIIDKSLGKHITPITLKSTIKSNPLYSDIHVDDDWDEKKKTPSWTAQDYDRQSLHSNLASHIKVIGLCAEFEQVNWCELYGACINHCAALLIFRWNYRSKYGGIFWYRHDTNMSVIRKEVYTASEIPGI